MGEAAEAVSAVCEAFVDQISSMLAALATVIALGDMF
jgi:hypothetical protein